MSQLKPDYGAYVDAAAAAIDLPIDPAWRPGVVANFARIAEIAALVQSFDLPDEEEPAPVFVP